MKVSKSFFFSPDSGKPFLVNVGQGLGIYCRVSPEVWVVPVTVSVGQHPLLETWQLHDCHEVVTCHVTCCHAHRHPLTEDLSPCYSNQSPPHSHSPNCAADCKAAEADAPLQSNRKWGSSCRGRVNTLTSHLMLHTNIAGLALNAVNKI